MKKSVLFCLVCSLMLFASCKFSSLNYGGGSIIHPSDNIVKKEFKQPSFSKIDVDVVANVKFIQSQEGDYRVVLSAPDNYIDLFKFEVGGDELDVDFTRDNINIEPKNVDITIYSPTLSKLENSGVASVEVDRLTTDELKLDNSGVGKIFFRGIKARVVKVDCSGVGGVEISGTADEAQFECSGVGSISAQDLKATSVKAEVSGVGGIQCYAEKSIKGEVSGVGSLKYGGNPTEKKLERSGVGGISQL